jgi:hypothetical protein
MDWVEIFNLILCSILSSSVFVVCYSALHILQGTN